MAMTGASGVGKTQMLRAIVESLIYQGEILYDGKLSSQFPAPIWRKILSLVPAESVWWRDSVSEHFPGQMETALLVDRVERLGFEKDILQWKVSRLSTGEKQRLALLRSLANEPAVVLLDEPCSALDENSVIHVETLLLEYKSLPGKALIWVSHDMDQLKRVGDSCRRVLLKELETLW